MEQKIKHIVKPSMEMSKLFYQENMFKLRWSWLKYIEGKDPSLQPENREPLVAPIVAAFK